MQEYFELDYFFARKWLLAVLWLDLLFFLAGLEQWMSLMKRVPIVLIGREYWEPFLKWVIDEALKHGLVEKEHVELIALTDDPYEVFCLIRDACKVK